MTWALPLQRYDSFYITISNCERQYDRVKAQEDEINDCFYNIFKIPRSCI